MRYLLKTAAAIVILLLTVAVAPTEGVAQKMSCQNGFYYDAASEACKRRVKLNISRQDRATLNGPQWGPVNKKNCDAASREMDRMARKCRNMDAQKAVSDALRDIKIDGKTLNQCAFCCRNLREGMNRWIQCHAAGLAPVPDRATANRSAERMNCGFAY